MIVKDVTRLARELDKACKKKGEIISMSLNYVMDRGVEVHMTVSAFTKHFMTYTISEWSELYIRASTVVDGITYFALLDQDEVKRYGVYISGTEDR